MNRLNHFFLLIALSALLISPELKAQDDYEEMKCQKKLRSLDGALAPLPLSEIMVEIGRSFMGTPYVAGTLDEDPVKESVVVNVTGLDCVTFVENCLVMARILKENRPDFDTYMKVLEMVRYRDGKNTGYVSRLHYFSDWIYDNQSKGIVKNISRELGGVPYDKVIDFMSAHSGSYKQLSSPENLEGIIKVEESINTHDAFYIPEDMIEAAYVGLRSGDIVGITSTLDGLDIAHTGLVYKDESGTYLLHASLKNKKVEISREQLHEYIAANPKQDGIMVARVIDLK